MDEAEAPEPLAQRTARHDDERLLALSDGVFGFAMTLLALDVRPAFDTPGRLWPALLPSLTAFVISFAVTAIFWLTHKRLYVRLRRIDGRLTALNLLLLGEIALLPAATQLLYHRPGPEAHRAYLALIGVIGLTQAAAWAYAALASDLVHDEVPRRFRIVAVASNAVTPVLMAGAVIYGTNAQSALGAAGAVAVVVGYLALRRRLAGPERAPPPMLGGSG